MNPYRQGPPSYPPEPSPATWRTWGWAWGLATAAFVLFVVGVEDGMHPTSGFAIGMFIGALRAIRDYGCAYGRRMQHELWLKAMSPTSEPPFTEEELSWMGGKKRVYGVPKQPIERPNSQQAIDLVLEELRGPMEDEKQRSAERTLKLGK